MELWRLEVLTVVVEEGKKKTRTKREREKKTSNGLVFLHSLYNNNNKFSNPTTSICSCLHLNFNFPTLHFARGYFNLPGVL